MRKFISICLVILLCFSVSSVAFASSDSSPVNGSAEQTDNPDYSLIGRYPITASECRSLYYEMSSFGSWTSACLSACADALSDFGNYTYSAAFSLMSSLSGLYFSTVSNAYYRGWQSGNGATVLVYSNALPSIIAS